MSPIIDHVYSHSPAEAAGLKIGDAIVQIDGANVSGLLLAQIRSLLSKDGKEVELVVDRRGALHKYLLRLRGLISRNSSFEAAAGYEDEGKATLICCRKSSASRRPGGFVFFTPPEPEMSQGECLEQRPCGFGTRPKDGLLRTELNASAEAELVILISEKLAFAPIQGV